MQRIIFLAAWVSLFSAPFSAQAGKLTLPGFGDFQGIINGVPAGPTEAIRTSTVSVNMGMGSCTGTIVADRVVLTAAHCTDLGGTIQNISLRTDNPQPCETAEVEEVAYVPGSNTDDTGYHLADIALVKLKTSICGAKPAILPQAAVATGDVVTVAGYGQGTPYMSVAPHRTNIKTILADRPTLENLYSDLTDPSDVGDAKELIDSLLGLYSRFYTFALPEVSGTSLCFGDSGGPVYSEQNGQVTVVGVNGAIVGHKLKGTPACRNAYMQLYTPTFPHVEWMTTKIIEWSVPAPQYFPGNK